MSSGSASNDCVEIVDGGGDGHETGADPQATLASQSNRTGHARSTAYKHDPAEIALVGLAAATRQGAGDLALDQPREQRLEARLRGRRHLKVVENEPTDQLGPGAEKQAGLERNEADRAIRAHRRAHDRAAVGIQSRRQIERKHRPTAGVDRLNRPCQSRPHGFAQAGSKQGIDNEFRPSEQRRIESMDATVAGAKLLRGALRIAVQRFRRHRGEHLHGKPYRLRKTRQHIAVAAVVAATGDDGDAHGGRPAAAHRTQRGLGRPPHQGVSVRALRNRVCIERAHLGGGVQIVGGAHRLIILGVTRCPCMS